MAAKPKLKTKQTSTELYFRAIQQDLMILRQGMARGFRAIRQEMATKQELGDVRASITDLRADITMITETMVSKADLAETVRRELDVAPFAKEREIKELRERISVVERKLGIERSRNAA